MKNAAPARRVRCLSCGATQTDTASTRARPRSASERFAFADCPRCGCLRMMARERADRAAGATDREQEATAT
jgi:hypothetical protein